MVSEFPALQKHRFNAFLTEGVRLRNPLTFISPHIWESLICTLTKEELAAEKNSLIGVEQALELSLNEYQKDLQDANQQWQETPGISKFNSAATLLEFYRIRALETQKHLVAVRRKIQFISDLLMQNAPTS